MRKFLGTLTKLSKDEEGAALIEYTVLLGSCWLPSSLDRFRRRVDRHPVGEPASRAVGAMSRSPGNWGPARNADLTFCRLIVERQLRALHEADVIAAAGIYFSSAFFLQTPNLALTTWRIERCAEAI